MSKTTLRQKLTKINNRLSRYLATRSRNSKFAILLTVDMALIPISYALILWFSDGMMINQALDVPGLIIIMALTGGIASIALGLPRIKLSTYEQTGIQLTAGYGTIVGLIGGMISKVFFNSVADPMFMMTFAMLLIIMSVSVRLLMRNILVAIYQRGRDRHRVLIYGAGQTGVQLAAALDTDDAVEPVAFVDDNPTLQKIMVAGLPVHSPARLQRIVKDLRVDRVVLAMPSNSRPKQARLSQYLKTLDCEVSILPSFASLVGEGDLNKSLQPANPTDFLGRDGLDKELAGGCDAYSGTTVMITGAGGSIGSELARQVLNCHPKKIVLFEVSEYALYQIDRELNDYEYGDCEIVPVLGSVTNAAHVLRTLKEHAVETMLHAAAYKHVTMVEKNRLSGLYNNVIGTRVVAKAARDAGIANFILVSTDKSVHPTNVMGASKRLAELLVQDISTRSPHTRFGIVRFGNVLGSSGSVIPLFEEQIARGGPVTLTHNEVTRYFMTISEAARLVLLVVNQRDQADEHGQVYLLDMGAPVSIGALARQMIEAAGFTVCDRANPNGDIEISILGLRPGEKMHEELAMLGYDVSPTEHPKIMRVQESRLSEIEMASALKALIEAIDDGDEDAAVEVLRRWVGPSIPASKRGDRPLINSLPLPASDQSLI